MTKLVLNSEILNNVLDGKIISRDEIIQIYESAVINPNELFAAARNLREKYKGEKITFSKKVFFNIINLCKDTCSYCTYKSEPNESKLSLMSKSELKQLLRLAKKYRCVEALFVTGEQPEKKYQEARDWLKSNGFKSTAEYLIYASELSLEMGLFPHTNAGNLLREDLKELQKSNVSMGIMLENISERLTKKGMPHYLASSKQPNNRLDVLKNAGTLKIPMTTGVLVGIGETPIEIIDSILALKKLQMKYGNIQEIIIQNFQPKPDTLMNDFPPADKNYFKIIVALTRIISPEMNIQVPPNLSPNIHQDFLNIGINDWGGISPLTPDYVNPEFPWPAINRIQDDTNTAGYTLECRFPVYPEYFSFIDNELRNKMKPIEDENGFVKKEYWK